MKCNQWRKVSKKKRKITDRSALVSGCKIVDVLDCLGEGRQLLSLRTSSRAGNPMVRDISRCNPTSSILECGDVDKLVSMISLNNILQKYTFSNPLCFVLITCNCIYLNYSIIIVLMENICLFHYRKWYVNHFVNVFRGKISQQSLIIQTADSWVRV